MELCLELHSENGAFPISTDKVRALLRGALTPEIDQRKGLIGVVGERGAIQGSICLEVDALWYTQQHCLLELWNHVLPQHRNSTNSSDLIAFAKSMADHFGLELMIGVLSTVRTEAKVRLYRKQLGEPAGAFFKYSPVVLQRMN